MLYVCRLIKTYRVNITCKLYHVTITCKLYHVTITCISHISFVCFERSPRPNDTADRFVISLKDITSFAKVSQIYRKINVTNSEKLSTFLYSIHDACYSVILYIYGVGKKYTYLSLCLKTLVGKKKWRNGKSLSLVT